MARTKTTDVSSLVGSVAVGISMLEDDPSSKPYDSVHLREISTIRLLLDSSPSAHRSFSFHCSSDPASVIARTKPTDVSSPVESVAVGISMLEDDPSSRSYYSVHLRERSPIRLLLAPCSSP